MSKYESCQSCGEDILLLNEDGYCGPCVEREKYAIATFVDGACSQFKSSGFRAGMWPANEGPEYELCVCGEPRGDHD